LIFKAVNCSEKFPRSQAGALEREEREENDFADRFADKTACKAVLQKRKL